MINKINFTGREEMLVKIGKKAEQKTDFFSESKMLTKEEWENVDKFIKSKKSKKIEKPANAEYSNPFASCKKESTNSVETDNGYLYAIEHGASEDVAKENAKKFLFNA